MKFTDELEVVYEFKITNSLAKMMITRSREYFNNMLPSSDYQKVKDTLIAMFLDPSTVSLKIVEFQRQEWK